MGSVQTNRRIALYAGALTVLFGCSQNHRPETVLTSEPDHEVAKEVAHDTWKPEQTSGILQYEILDSATISMTGDTTHTVPIQTSTIYSVSLVSIGDSFALVGKVDSINTNTRARDNKNPNDTNNLREFHAAVGKDGKVSMLSENHSSTCGNGVEPAATRLFDLKLTFNTKAMRAGDRWTDTVSAIICRGKTALTQQTIRQYQLLQLEKWKEHDAVTISRTGTSIFTGSSTDIKNHLSTSGSGASSTVIHADKDTGQLLESDGHSQSILSVSTSRGVYPFTQNVVTHIELR